MNVIVHHYALASLVLGVIPAVSHAQAYGFAVGHYDVQLEPRLESRTVTGTVTLSVVVNGDDVETITLNRGRLEIDSVQEDGRARAFVIDGNRVRIRLPRDRANEPRLLTVTYHGAPSSGLVFSEEREQITSEHRSHRSTFEPRWSRPAERISAPSSIAGSITRM